MTDRKRILVLDDDEDICFLMDMYLKKMGIAADFVTRGDEAVERYRQAFVSGDRYAAAILDLHVAGSAGGKDVAAQLLAIDSAAVLIVMSGDEYDPVMVDYLQHGFSARMAKPFRYDAAAEVIGRIV